MEVRRREPAFERAGGHELISGRFVHCFPGGLAVDDRPRFNWLVGSA
jgi:hypothetical protein